MFATLQYILTYLDCIENILILFYPSFHNHYKKINFYTLYKLLPFNMKSINPVQKYPHITESHAYIL